MNELYVLWVIIGASMYFSLTMFVSLMALDKIRNHITKKVASRMVEEGYIRIKPTMEKASNKISAFSGFSADSSYYEPYGLGVRSLQTILGEQKIVERRTGFPAKGLTATKEEWVEDKRGTLESGEVIAYLVTRYRKDPSFANDKKSMEEFLSMDKEAMEVEMAMYRVAL